MKKIDKNEKVIEVKNLIKKYGKKTVVKGLSFDVYKGEILGFLGPNGSGKTTTINSILSILKFNDGDVKIFGKKMSSKNYDIKRKIGVVFQEIAVFDELTVEENIDYFCGLYIKNKKERKKCVEDAMNIVEITNFKKYYPKKLSGGLLRRLNIACGIAHKPELIFLDEPTVSVDPQSRNKILDNIKELNENGATIVYTTHYMEEVEELCDRIVILDEGKLIAEGTSDSLKEKSELHEKINIKIPEEYEEKLLEKIKNNKDIRAVNIGEDGIIKIEYIGGKNNLVRMINFLKEEDIPYDNIFMERPTLNDVFLELTGKGLRD